MEKMIFSLEALQALENWSPSSDGSKWQDAKECHQGVHQEIWSQHDSGIIKDSALI